MSSLTELTYRAQRWRMPLEMHQACERCDRPLSLDDDQALICSYECTFCETCSAEMSHTCPNCGGELVRRPRRIARL